MQCCPCTSLDKESQTHMKNASKSLDRMISHESVHASAGNRIPVQEEGRDAGCQVYKVTGANKLIRILGATHNSFDTQAASGAAEAATAAAGAASSGAGKAGSLPEGGTRRGTHETSRGSGASGGAEGKQDCLIANAAAKQARTSAGRSMDKREGESNQRKAAANAGREAAAQDGPCCRLHVSRAFHSFCLRTS